MRQPCTYMAKICLTTWAVSGSGKRKELDKAEARLGEINLLFRKLYEDNASGQLSNEQFVFLTSGYEDVFLSNS